MENNLHTIIEALLFVSDSPLTLAKIKGVIEETDTKSVREAVNLLNEEYTARNSALQVIEVANGYLMVTREDYQDQIKKMFKTRSSSRLTQKGLETLAIIAYKQPITKVELEKIRGVNVDGVVRTLLERNLVTIVGREKAPGNPLLYGTTSYFLEYFGLKSLDSLPKLKEIDEILKGDEKFLESLDQVALEQLPPEILGIKNINEMEQSQIDFDEDDTNENENKNPDENGTKDQTE